MHNRGAAQSLFLAGRIGFAPSRTQTLAQSYSMFAPCYSVEGVALNDTLLGTQGSIGGLSPLDSDRILRFDPIQQLFFGQFFFDSGENPGFDEMWFPETGAPGENFELEAGEGFFYRHQGASDLDWNQTRPYELPQMVP